MDYATFRAGRLAAGLSLGLAALVCGCQKPAPTTTAEIELPSDDQLRDRIDNVLDFTFANRHLNTKDQAAWQIVHGVLMYGRDFQIYHDQKLVPALAYLLGGGQLRGWTMHKGDHGLEAVLEAGSKMGQGHEDQWLGYLSQCNVSLDEPIVVAGTTYKVRDLLTQAQWDIYDGMESTWTLMALSTYLPLDAEWTAKDGSKWNIERIVRMETAQPLGDSSCGGTHRMFALTVAMNRYLAAGGKLSENGDGTWERAHKKIRDAIEAAHQNQQPDGSFSTNYFERPASSAEIDKRISTTGHVLEFLVLAMDDKELQEPWVTRAAAHLVGCFEMTEKFDLECGALYHAAHGLSLYRTRRFGERPIGPSSEQSEPASTAAAVRVEVLKPTTEPAPAAEAAKPAPGEAGQ
jgi:hypothetical protein